MVQVPVIMTYWKMSSSLPPLKCRPVTKCDSVCRQQIWWPEKSQWHHLPSHGRNSLYPRGPAGKLWRRWWGWDFEETFVAYLVQANNLDAHLAVMNQTCLRTLSPPPLPSSALCLWPVPRFSSERGCCANWVSEPPHAVRCVQSFSRGQDVPGILATLLANLPAATLPLGTDTAWLILLFMVCLWANFKVEEQRGGLSPRNLLLFPGNKRRKKSRDGERNLEEGSDHLPLTS